MCRSLLIPKGLRKASEQDPSWHRNPSETRPAELWASGLGNHTNGATRVAASGKKAPRMDFKLVSRLSNCQFTNT